MPIFLMRIIPESGWKVQTEIRSTKHEIRNKFKLGKWKNTKQEGIFNAKGPRDAKWMGNPKSEALKHKQNGNQKWGRCGFLFFVGNLLAHRGRQGIIGEIMEKF